MFSLRVESSSGPAPFAFSPGNQTSPAPVARRPDNRPKTKPVFIFGCGSYSMFTFVSGYDRSPVPVTEKSLRNKTYTFPAGLGPFSFSTENGGFTLDPKPGSISLIKAPLTSFPQFSSLPVEIRLMIWEYAREPPQIIRVDSRTTSKTNYVTEHFSIAPVPVLLQVCRESRNLAYKKWYGYKNAENIWCKKSYGFNGYYDPDYDYLWRGCEACFFDDVEGCRYCCGYCSQIETRLVAKNIMVQGSFGDHFPFLTVSIRCPMAEKLVLLSPECLDRDFYNVRTRFENLGESAFFEIDSAELMSLYQERAKRYLARKIIPTVRIKSIRYMAVNITPETCKLYGFMAFKFLEIDMDLEHNLSKEIPGRRCRKDQYMFRRRCITRSRLGERFRISHG